MKILENTLVVVLAIITFFYPILENFRQGWAAEIWPLIEFHNYLFLCVCIFCALGWFMLRLYHHSKIGQNWVSIIGGILAMLLSWAIVGFFVNLFVTDATGENHLHRYFSYSGDKKFILGVAIGITASVWEEVFFRGFLQTILVKSLGRIFGVLSTAVCFGVLHPKFDDSMYLFAISLGIASFCTRSLLAGFLAHAFFNFMVNFSKFGSINIVSDSYSDFETISIAVLNMSVSLFIPLSLIFNVLVFKLLNRRIEKRDPALHI